MHTDANHARFDGWRAVAGAVLLLALAGCDRIAPAPAAPDPRKATMPLASIAQKNGTGALRSELEPLLKRFPPLGRPLGAKWMSGTMGDARVPGPSTYWIDAVVMLQPEHAASLRRQYAVTPAAANESPDVVAGLRPHLPAGPWQRSDALDAALSQLAFPCKALLSGDQLVLMALGE